MSLNPTVLFLSSLGGFLLGALLANDAYERTRRTAHGAAEAGR